MLKWKRTNNDLQNNTQKIKDRATHYEPGVNSGGPEGSVELLLIHIITFAPQRVNILYIKIMIRTLYVLYSSAAQTKNI